jgi:hypothetical protein
MDEKCYVPFSSDLRYADVAGLNGPPAPIATFNHQFLDIFN